MFQAFCAVLLIFVAMYGSAQIGLNRATTFEFREIRTYHSGFTACIGKRGNKEFPIYVRKGQKCPATCMVRP